MARTEEYRRYILDLLDEYKQYKTRENYELQTIADTKNDHYQLLMVGWKAQERILSCVFHFDIKDGKIWVQHNGTDRNIVGELPERGVPPADIVLGFHAPYKRPYTGFAVG